MAAPTNLQQYQAQLQANQAALGQQLLLPPQREYRSYHYHRRGVGTSGVAITAPFSVAWMVAGLLLCHRRHLSLFFITAPVTAHIQSGVPAGRLRIKWNL